MNAPVYHVRDWAEHFETFETRKIKCTTYIPTPNKQDGFGFRRMMAQRDAVELFAAWHFIIQVASRGKGLEQRGWLMRDGQPLTAEDLAITTGVAQPIFDRALEFFTDPKQGWLETVSMDTALEAFSSAPPRPALLDTALSPGAPALQGDGTSPALADPGSPRTDTDPAPDVPPGSPAKPPGAHHERPAPNMAEPDQSGWPPGTSGSSPGTPYRPPKAPSNGNGNGNDLKIGTGNGRAREVELLVSDILAVTKDESSRRLYMRIAAEVPRTVVDRALSETRAAASAGQIRTTPARFFTACVRSICEQQKIPVPMKARAGRAA
jgi:hypothetical protein